MRVLRAAGEPNLVYVLLTDTDAEELRAALRKGKSPMLKRLRAELRKVLR